MPIHFYYCYAHFLHVSGYGGLQVLIWAQEQALVEGQEGCEEEDR